MFSIIYPILFISRMEWKIKISYPSSAFITWEQNRSGIKHQKTVSLNKMFGLWNLGRTLTGAVGSECVKLLTRSRGSSDRSRKIWMGAIVPISFKCIFKNHCFTTKENSIFAIIWWWHAWMEWWRGTGIGMDTSEHHLRSIASIIRMGKFISRTMRCKNWCQITGNMKKAIN